MTSNTQSITAGAGQFHIENARGAPRRRRSLFHGRCRSTCPRPKVVPSTVPGCPRTRPAARVGRRWRAHPGHRGWSWPAGRRARRDDDGPGHRLAAHVTPSKTQFDALVYVLSASDRWRSSTGVATGQLAVLGAGRRAVARRWQERRFAPSRCWCSAAGRSRSTSPGRTVRGERRTAGRRRGLSRRTASARCRRSPPRRTTSSSPPATHRSRRVAARAFRFLLVAHFPGFGPHPGC